MTKKALALILAVVFLLPGSANAESTDKFEGHWELNTTRTVIFATDGGTYIRPLEQELGTVVFLNEYLPVKKGYIFDGWYADPRTKVERVNEITLNENMVVFAKWVDAGTPKPEAETHRYASNEEILAFGKHIDEKTGVPVTALWVQQNARLQELMEMYHQNFNQ